VHGHVAGFLEAAKNRSDVEIAGIFDADTDLLQQCARKYGLDSSLLFTDLAACWNA
jgi:predicted dehydrogenase